MSCGDAASEYLPYIQTGDKLKEKWGAIMLSVCVCVCVVVVVVGCLLAWIGFA